MKINILHIDELKVNTEIFLDCIIIPFFEDPTLKKITQNKFFEQEHSAQLEQILQGEFSGKKQEIFILNRYAGYKKIIFLGLGKETKYKDGQLRKAVGTLKEEFQKKKHSRIVFYLNENSNINPCECIEALTLSQYTFNQFKTTNSTDTKIDYVIFCISNSDNQCYIEKEISLNKTYTICQATNWARDLANCPANYMTPTKLGEEAAEIARLNSKVKINIYNKQQIKEMNMGAFLAVAQGTTEEAKLICLEYTTNNKDEKIALVGKAVTFDTGGISLKPSAKMQEMKFDMCGGATTLATFRAIVELQLDINVVAIVPATENCVGSSAIKPGDIITSYNGKTIEINNTDAEGRLILADALSFVAEKYSPTHIIDLATLTGACVAALGHSTAAVITNSDDFYHELKEVSQGTDENIWQLPLDDHYKSLMKGTFADLSNLGPAYAGTITAGAFLSNFIPKNSKWIHLDIAGVAWNRTDLNYLDPKYASGFGVKLLTNWAKTLESQQS